MTKINETLISAPDIQSLPERGSLHCFSTFKQKTDYCWEYDRSQQMPAAIFHATLLGKLQLR